MHSVRAFVLLTAGLTLACSGALDPPLTPPDEGGPSWITLRTPHFDVYTDLSAAKAEPIARDFEGIYKTFTDVAFPFTAKPEGRTAVVVFRDRFEYRALFGRLSSGLYNPFAREEGLPSIFLYGDRDLTDDSRQTFQHELTHRFVHFYFPGAPTWVHEGLACYYSTMTVKDGKVVLGREMPDHRMRPGMLWDSKEDPRWGVISWAPTGRFLSAEQLARGDRADFTYRSVEFGQRLEEGRRIHLSYMSAWSLVHVLKNSPEGYAPRFDRYLLALGGGADPQAAWSEHFGEVSFAALDSSLQAFYMRRETTVLRAPYEVDPSAGDDPAVSAMSPDAVRLLWAAIRPWTPENLAAVRADLAAAKLLAPGSPATPRWEARVALREGREADAEEHLRVALARDPNDERSLLDRFTLLSARAERSPEALPRVEALVPKMLAHATTAASLNAIARHLARGPRLAEAQQLALRAVQADFRCFECFDTLALVLYRRGAVAEAFRMQSVALNLVPDGYDDPEMLLRWQQYRDAPRR